MSEPEPTPTEPVPTEPTPTPTPEAIVPVVPSIVTIEELMSSHLAIVGQETADRAKLEALTSPTAAVYRPRLLAWAAVGFPPIFVVRAFNITPPSVCSDGVTRDAVNYVWYLLGTEIGDIIANIQSLMPGILVSYSFDQNKLQIHVTKA